MDKVETLPDLSELGQNLMTREWTEELLELDCSFFKEEVKGS